MKRALTAFFCCLVAGLLGCGYQLPELRLDPPPEIPRGPSALRVGTARADLTMPPGPAMFGHGPDSRVAEGFWTRTYCRVFFFVTDAGQRLALVPCELPAMSLLLQRRVAEQVKDVLHASQLMMTATHTHASVGHYFGARQYTSIFSSRLPGYDENIANELARRIAKAVREASEHLEPARISWLHRENFWCFTRNRSLAAHELNRPAFVASRPPPPCTDGHPELAAIDPSMDVLRIDAFDPKDPTRDLGPIGSISFFAMHPTVVRNNNQLFGGDLFALVSRNVEAHLRRAQCKQRGAACDPDSDPLHGVVNTNEGDISPVWRQGDIEEAIKVGTALSKFVRESHRDLEPEPPQRKNLGDPSPIVDSIYVEEDITKARFSEGGQTYRNCGYGQIGQGAAQGGTDHRTSFAPLSMFGSDPVADYQSQGCHAPKKPLLGKLLSLSTRLPGSFPTGLPLALANLGDTVIAFVPAELTVTAGHRLKDRVRSELSRYRDAPKHVVVAGLANEYIQYVATEEEYQYQDYEGASTIFGPNSSRYLNHRFALLTNALFDPAFKRELEERHRLGPGVVGEVSFGFGTSIDTIIDGGGEYERQHLETCVMPAPPSSEEPPRICMYWKDGGPKDVALGSEPWISLVNHETPPRRARFCLPDDTLTCDPRGAVDDRGVEFITRIHDRVDGHWIWSTLFSPSRATWTDVGNRSVKIFVNGSPGVESQPFGGGCLPARCTVRQARLCRQGVRTDDWKGLVPED